MADILPPQSNAPTPVTSPATPVTNQPQPTAKALGVTPISTSMSYQDVAKNTPSTLEFMKQQEADLGIPEQQRAQQTMRDQIFSLEDSLKRVASTVAATTRNSFVTQGQRNLMIDAAQKPIQQNLTDAGTNYSRTTEALNALQDRAARLTSGFTADKQNQLELSLAAIKRGEQLTDQQRQEAFQTMMAEQEFNRAKEKMKLQQQLNIQEYNATTARTAAASRAAAAKDTSSAADYLKQLNNAAATGTATKTTPVLPKAPTVTNSRYPIGSPPMDSPKGVIAEYPKGSGTYWESTGGGWK